MEQEKIKLKQMAEQLAEKYEDTKDKQEELTERQDIDCRSNLLVVSVNAMCLNFLKLIRISEGYARICLFFVCLFICYRIVTNGRVS
jgi:hypothetical protein